MAASSTNCEVQRLRREHYNAAVVGMRRVHDDLLLLRVRPDQAPSQLTAGQYTALGLGAWEPRLAGTQREPPGTSRSDRLIKRAYSICSPLLDDQGRLIRVGHGAWLEFYLALVRFADPHPPALTPRLFAIREGDRLFCGTKARGTYTLAGVAPQEDVVFAATGVGEAPHNAMIAELLAGGHRGRIVAVTCVRHNSDLAYLAAHRELERRYENYRYLCLTTREPANIDPGHPKYVGKQYLQDYFLSGGLERDASITVRASGMHVYLCGNPEMIGARRFEDSSDDRGRPPGMLQLLESRGLQADSPRRRGNVHFEKYW